MSRVVAGYAIKPAPDPPIDRSASMQSSKSDPLTTSGSLSSLRDQFETSTRCRLLELPAELRNRTYELVLYIEPSADGRVYLCKRPTFRPGEKHSTAIREWHLTIKIAMELFDEQASRDMYSIEKALQKLSSKTKVTWESGAEDKQPQLDEFVAKLEERKRKAEEAKRKRLEKKS